MSIDRDSMSFNLPGEAESWIAWPKCFHSVLTMYFYLPQYRLLSCLYHHFCFQRSLFAIVVPPPFIDYFIAFSFYLITKDSDHNTGNGQNSICGVQSTMYIMRVIHRHPSYKDPWHVLLYDVFVIHYRGVLDLSAWILIVFPRYSHHLHWSAQSCARTFASFDLALFV